MSYSAQQALNRVVSPRFATSPLSPGAVDVRDFYEARGRLGGRLGTRLMTRVVRGPDLRSRVTRFGQGIAFTPPRIVTATAAQTKAATPPPVPHFAPPGMAPTTTGKLVPISSTPGGSTPSTPKVVVWRTGGTFLGAKPVPTPTTAGMPPSTPSSAPTTNLPLQWAQEVLGSGGGMTDQGFTPAPPPATAISPTTPAVSDGGGGGGAPLPMPSDSTGSAPAPSGLAIDPSTLLWVGLGALGLILLATSR